MADFEHVSLSRSGRVVRKVFEIRRKEDEIQKPVNTLAGFRGYAVKTYLPALAFEIYAGRSKVAFYALYVSRSFVYFVYGDDERRF